MAAAAGVNVCESALVPLEALDPTHGYALGGSAHFLAVSRFDRQGAKRIHCEDFAQVLGVDPRNKYTGATYAGVAAVMMRYPDSLGLAAVHELLRLITINELMGNYEAHFKNFCLSYPDGTTPVLSKAFDIVAWSAYLGGQDHALALYRAESKNPEQPKVFNTLSPGALREFCNRVGIAEQACTTVIRDTVALALQSWPGMIAKSTILDEQKERLITRIQSRSFAQRRSRRVVAP